MIFFLPLEKETCCNFECVQYSVSTLISFDVPCTQCRSHIVNGDGCSCSQHFIGFITSHVAFTHNFPVLVLLAEKQSLFSIRFSIPQTFVPQISVPGLLFSKGICYHEDFRSPDCFHLRNTCSENLFLEKQCVLRFSYWEI